MVKNVGNADRAVRIVAGVAIITAGIYFKSWWGALGAPLLVTGIIRYCPGYVPFSISTAGSKS